MNFRQIETFLEVAKAGSFSIASQRLSLPASTVSARIKALEDRWRVRLFRRTTRKVALTNEGQRYFSICQEAVDLLANLEEAGDQSKELKGLIRLTVPVDMSKSRLSKVLCGFIDQHPAVKIEVIVTDDILDFIDGNIDIALRGRAPGTDSLISRRLSLGRLGLFASPDYIAERAECLEAADFSGCVLYDPFGQARHIKPLVRNMIAPAISSNNTELCKALSLRSEGVALLSQSICEEEVQSGRLIELPQSEGLPELPLYLVMPSKKLLPERIRKLVDHLVIENRQIPLV
ncbi:MAG: LysR family transcriptional regulator [Sneathiellales bacterium]|nr:LysR family transcriptional regulator [Sneathiellales bacterium]